VQPDVNMGSILDSDRFRGRSLYTSRKAHQSAKAVPVGAVPPIMVRTEATRVACRSGIRRVPGRPGGQSCTVLPRRSVGSVLWLQPFRCEGLARHDRQLVASRNDGCCEGALRLHQAFSETDFTEDLKAINVPVLIMHGDDDEIVPIAEAALLSTKLVKKGTLNARPR
jgi:non-heme chloroperoxidase